MSRTSTRKSHCMKILPCEVFLVHDLQGAVAAEAWRPSDAGSIFGAHKIL
ncbi:hypothetical protein CASFOL_002039 [Castilleja foliolosa]|uniref:Uncharacterized protein n=1 Tax=Castilleja foliolosa TaxID=1961234 RepID=A0ABD3ED51_9LAMI